MARTKGRSMDIFCIKCHTEIFRHFRGRTPIYCKICAEKNRLASINASVKRNYYRKKELFLQQKALTFSIDRYNPFSEKTINLKE